MHLFNDLPGSTPPPMRFTMRFNMPLRGTPHPAPPLRTLRNFCVFCGKNKIVLAALFVASLWICHANSQQVVFQFEASKNVTTGTNLTWQSIGRTGGALPPQLVADTADWQFKTQNGVANVANVKGITAEPMWFAEGMETNLTVRHIVAVVRTPPAIQGMSTLFCGEQIYRTAGIILNKNPNGNAVAYIDTGRFCKVSWNVDGVEGAPLRANSTHLLEITFATDVKLHTLGIGNDTGRADAWMRAFTGSYMSMVGFAGTPPDEVRDMVARHYIQQHGLEIPPPPFSINALHAARALGMNFGTYYGTRILIR